MTVLDAVGGQRHAPVALPPGKDLVPVLQEAGLAPGPVYICEENLAPPPGFDPRTVQPVASLYRLSYPSLPPDSSAARV